jgi:hypothetical protein
MTRRLLPLLPLVAALAACPKPRPEMTVRMDGSQLVFDAENGHAEEVLAIDVGPAGAGAAGERWHAERRDRAAGGAAPGVDRSARLPLLYGRLPNADWTGTPPRPLAEGVTYAVAIRGATVDLAALFRLRRKDGRPAVELVGAANANGSQ